MAKGGRSISVMTTRGIKGSGSGVKSPKPAKGSISRVSRSMRKPHRLK